MATMSTTEKEKALKDLHEIPDTLQSIGRVADQLTKINVNLERIADALEDIATEAKRPHEEAMEQQRRREAAAGRAYSSISSGRGFSE